MANNTPKMVEKQIPSALPIYLAAAVFLLASLVLPIYKLWAIVLAAVAAGAAYGIGSKKIKPRVVLVPAPATVYATGEAALDATLAKAEQDLDALAALNQRIPDPQLSAAITRMEQAGHSILAQVAKEPSKAKSIRKFVSYYLPTSIKILTTYADLVAAGAKGQNAQSLLHQVQQNADTIAQAFESQLDALFAGEVLDVSSDLAVLDSMAKGDGLTGADWNSPAPQGPTLTL